MLVDDLSSFLLKIVIQVECVALAKGFYQNCIHLTIFILLIAKKSTYYLFRLVTSLVCIFITLVTSKP